MSGPASALARPCRVAVEASAVRALPSADYADAFAVPTDALMPAIARTRLAFAVLPPVLRMTISTAWRHVLGLRLVAADDPQHVVGWAVSENAPERLVLRAGSWLVDACLVVDATDDRTGITTLVHYRNVAGRVTWRAVAPIHRRVAPLVLDRGRRAAEAQARS